MAWKTAQFRLTGVSPLIMHNGELANPLNPIVKEQKKISGKRGKTEADLEELARLEFIGGLYYSDNPGVILPAEVLEATINGGARKFKEGMSAKAGLVVMEHAKLEFLDNGLTPQELWEKEQYRFQKMVTVARARILRTRPIFDNWSADIEVTYEDTVCDTSQVYKWLKKAGEIVGLCDWRPRYGRFTVEAL
jgi:hypothetical protein